VRSPNVQWTTTVFRVKPVYPKYAEIHVQFRIHAERKQFAGQVTTDPCAFVLKDGLEIHKCAVINRNVQVTPNVLKIVNV